MPFIVSTNFTITAAIAVDRFRYTRCARRWYDRTSRYSGTNDATATAPRPRSSQSSSTEMYTADRIVITSS